MAVRERGTGSRGRRVARFIGRFAGCVVLGIIMAPMLGTAILSLENWRVGRAITPEGIGNSLVLGAWIGSPIGMIVAPITDVVLLRRVSFRRAMLVTSVGTVLGGVIGMRVWPMTDFGKDVGGVFLVCGAVAGFVASALLLWLRARRVPRTDPRVARRA